VTLSLAGVYVLNLQPSYIRMALTSLATLRQVDPDLPVIIKIADRMGETTVQQKRLFAMADRVDYITAVTGAYFPGNKTILREIDAERIIFIDADTIIFRSLRALDRRFAGYDIAACPSSWVWRRGFKRHFAPDILRPLNSGFVVMSRAFAQTWGTVNAHRPSEMLMDQSRAELVGWLRSVSPDAWPRGDMTLSELAWNGDWAVGLMGPRDCHLLSEWPEEEDPLSWRTASVLHTYSQLWQSCVARLVSNGWVDPAAELFSAGARMASPRRG
jgi:hypothetical protein